MEKNRFFLKEQNHSIFILIKKIISKMDEIKNFYQITEGYPLFEIKNEIWDKPELKMS